MTASDFFSVARRPRWIGALIVALALAAGFAALGQWQLARSVENAQVAADDIDTETPVPLSSIAVPQTTMTDPQLGRMVTIDAELVTGDFTVLIDRRNGRELGAWLVGHGRTPEGASIAIALGWTPDVDAARAAQVRLFVDTVSWTGRYLVSESPHESDFEAGTHSAMSVAELINVWTEAPNTVYAGYLVATDPITDGLTPIDSPPPIRDASLNWLNLFYAAEWVIFAGFAIYLWYRLVRDAWENEHPPPAS